VIPPLDMSGGRLKHFQPPNDGCWVGAAIDYTVWSYNLTDFVYTAGFNPGVQRWGGWPQDTAGCLQQQPWLAAVHLPALLLDRRLRHCLPLLQAPGTSLWSCP
jgi:hypothetical protein